MEKGFLSQTQILNSENSTGNETVTPEKISVEVEHYDALKSLMVFLKNTASKGQEFQKKVLGPILKIKG